MTEDANTPTVDNDRLSTTVAWAIIIVLFLSTIALVIAGNVLSFDSSSDGQASADGVFSVVFRSLIG